MSEHSPKSGPRNLPTRQKLIIEICDDEPSCNAAIGKEKTDVALQEFLTARILYNRRDPNAGKQPVYLIGRINRLLEKTLGTK